MAHSATFPYAQITDRHCARRRTFDAQPIDGTQTGRPNDARRFGHSTPDGVRGKSDGDLASVSFLVLARMN